jgi:hypothetical protein
MVSKNGRLKRRKNEKERERVKREKMGSGLERWGRHILGMNRELSLFYFDLKEHLNNLKEKYRKNSKEKE